VTDDLGPQRVHIGLASFEVRRDQRTTFGNGIGLSAVHGQTGVGRQADDDRRRRGRLHAPLGLLDLFALFLRQGLLVDDDATHGATAARSDVDRAARRAAATTTHTSEQAAAMAAVAAAGAASRRMMHRMSAAGAATMATIREQPTPGMAAARAAAH